MTDLSTLPPPDACARWARSADPARVIHGHHVTVNLTWWNNLLAEHGLPATLAAVAGEGGATVSAGRAPISRGDVFAAADGADTDPAAAVALLWRVLAWGSGNKVRLNRRRVAAVAGDYPRAAAALSAAARTARTDPAAAYTLLYPGGGTLIASLGPAFLTKFLYFAGRGAAGHPCQILDSRVASALTKAGWASLSPHGGWPPATYQRYCDLLARWGGQLQVRPDILERWLFDTG